MIQFARRHIIIGGIVLAVIGVLAMVIGDAGGDTVYKFGCALLGGGIAWVILAL